MRCAVLDYLDKCSAAENIRPKFVPDKDSLFIAEITPNGVFRLQKENSVLTMTFKEAIGLMRWLIKINQSE